MRTGAASFVAIGVQQFVAVHVVYTVADAEVALLR